jgi:hypothetical protein
MKDASRVPLDLLAAQAAWQSTAFRLLFHLAILELFFFPALSLLPGLKPAQAAICGSPPKQDISFPISAKMTAAASFWIPGMKIRSSTDAK